MFSKLVNFLFVFLAVSVVSCRHQTAGSFLVSAGSNVFDECYGLAIDSNKDIVVSGVFSRKINFNGSLINFELESKGASDFFVAKYSPFGKLLWAKSFGGIGVDEVANICVDKNNNIYITGFYTSTTNFLPYENAVNNKSFLLKLNSSGNIQWALNLSGKSVSEGTGICSINNSIYWTSFFEGTISDSLKSRGNSDILCLKVTDKGFILKQAGFGTKGKDTSRDIFATYNSHLFIAGAICLTDSENEISKACIFELDTNLSLLFQTSLIDTAESSALSIIVNRQNEKYISGSYVNHKKNNDAFLCKLSSENKVKWVNTFCSNQNDWAKGLAFDNDQNIISAVVLNDNARVASINQIIKGAGNYDIFISKLNKEGKIINYVSFGDDQEEGINKIIVDKDNNLISCGWFYKTLHINDNAITSKGEGDAFLFKDNLNMIFPK